MCVCVMLSCSKGLSRQRYDNATYPVDVAFKIPDFHKKK